MALIRDYFKKTDELMRDYGEKSIVLMQVGAFYEVYGLYENDDGKEETLTGSNISQFCAKSELNISKKNICVGSRPVAMAGFRDYMLDKYLKKLQDMGYTVAVYSQDEKAAGTTRSLTGIYSPGTFFSSDTSDEKITNNTMCIWLQKFRNKIVCGISNIDIYTGKSLMFEYNQGYSITPDAYDELEKYISIYNPSEVIIIHNLDDDTVENIIKFSGITTDCIHKHNLEESKDKNGNNRKIAISSTNEKRAKNCEKQVYQKEVLTRFFENIEYDEKYLNFPIATQSLCFLLDFIYTHNPSLVEKIEPPTFDNKSERLILANHSLKQLNIINGGEGQRENKHSSLKSLLNCCMTSMGKRLFDNVLLNPICSVSKLNKEYAIQEHFSLNYSDLGSMRATLGGVKDIERVLRKLYLKRISPADFYFLVKDIETLRSFYKGFENDDLLIDYLCPQKNNIDALATKIKKFIENTLDLDACNGISTSNDFDTNFVKRGFSEHHDSLVEAWMDSSAKVEAIRNYFNDFVKQYENKPKTKASEGKTKAPEYVKLHTTEKSGSSLITTKRRSAILKTALEKIAKENGSDDGVSSNLVTLSYYSEYNKQTKTMVFSISDIEFKDATGSNVSINNKDIYSLCQNIMLSKSKMVESLQAIYKYFIRDFATYHNQVETIVKFAAALDLLVCRVFIAKKYNYCAPVIKPMADGDGDESYVDVKGLRHPLIEQLLQQELYVTNDIALESEMCQGILLYGTNAVGKSSLIKALGMCIILAQSGFYVPCSSFVYFPFRHIFTRILGNDNLFKGLSSFAVEMIEFKTILSHADANSIVLGDELCSGTENNSAISIFVAGLDHLYKQKTKFVFATHFHEIAGFEEITEKEKLVLKHLAVSYDKEKDKLVYDRKLRNGPGESMYGLEVCKSLKLPTAFLRHAHEIRNKYCKKSSSILEYKPSRYNAKKLRGICERCKKNFSTEVHHIHHQKDANEDGFIGHFHKNHVANLTALCEECHLAEHHSS